MKKRIVLLKWKRYLAARSRSQMRANARFVANRRERAIKALGHRRHRKQFRKTDVLEGPEVFSLTQNPDRMTSFFLDLLSITLARNVYVDLSKVRQFTPEAIAALVAMIPLCQANGGRVSGNVPKDQSAKEMLIDSGFRRHVRTDKVSEARTPKGQIARRLSTGETSQDKFDQKLAKELMEFGVFKLNADGKPHGPTYAVLCEGMLNTLNHSGNPGTRRKAWWASVYVDLERSRACFTFIDLGVGIFRSHQLSKSLRALRAIGILDHAQILKRIFLGQIQSTTREPGRGNGIPGMYDHCKAGRIKDLTVISNDAIGIAEKDTYRVLSNEFPGTLLYWEIES